MTQPPRVKKRKGKKMKRLFLMTVAMLSMTMTFAETKNAANVNVVNESVEETYDMTVNMRKLSVALGLTLDQIEAVETVHNTFNAEMQFAAQYTTKEERDAQVKKAIEKDVKWVYELFPRLEERNWQLAGTLSGGEQQMLAMGRSLMAKPRLIMMDEPSMGLAPILVDHIFDIVKNLHEHGATILLVEQNAQAALSVADRGYVLETGKVVMTGTGKELLASPEIKKAYLGA